MRQKIGKIGTAHLAGERIRLVREIARPVGLVSGSGLKLPVVSTAPNEDLVGLVEVVEAPAWLPKLLGWIIRSNDAPRFVVRGHAAGTPWSVRVVVILEDGGREVGHWDRTITGYEMLGVERAIACEVVYKLSECSI